MKKILITLVVLASLVLAACSMPVWTAPAEPAAPTTTAIALATTTPTPFQPPTTTPMVVTPTPTVLAQPIVVVTATGVSDLGQLLGDQPMTPVAGTLIDWDHLKLYVGWDKTVGLSGKEVLYFQTGVPNSAPIPRLKESDGVFTVPTGVVLIYGAYKVSITLGDGKTYEFEKGFYNALPEGTIVRELFLTDGFALLIEAQYARDEFCMRLAQAVNEGWAHEHLYRPATWTEPVCEGVVTTPLDSDR